MNNSLRSLRFFSLRSLRETFFSTWQQVVLTKDTKWNFFINLTTSRSHKGHKVEPFFQPGNKSFSQRTQSGTFSSTWQQVVFAKDAKWNLFITLVTSCSRKGRKVESFHQPGNKSFS